MNNKSLGIMASYPELMRAAQGYQTGGPIMPPAAGRTLSPAPFIGYPPRRPYPLRPPVLTDDYFFAPFRGGELPRQSGPDALPVVPRDVSLREDVMNSPELRRQILAASAPSFGGAQTIGSVAREPQPDPVLELAEASEESKSRALEIEEMRKKGTKAAADFVMSLPDPVQALSKYADIFGSELAGTIASFIGATDTGAKFFDVAKEQRREDFGMSVEDMTSPMGGPRRGDPRRGRPPSAVEDMTSPMGGPRRGRPPSAAEDMTSPMGGPRRGRPPSAAERRLDTTDDQRAAATRAALPDIAQMFDDTTPAPDETLPPMITNDPEGTASEALSSLDKSYEEKLALFQKVFGGGDEDTSRDRAMSLAMIGLAIAAGQSPNALTNVAQGAMVGLQAMGAKEQARKEKREKTKLLALDAALKEHAAQQEFARELGLEAIKAGNKSQYRDTPTVRQEGAFGDVEVFLPTPEAAQQGAQPVIADVAGLDRKYRQSLEGRQKVFGMVDKAEQLIAEYDIAGFEGAMARFKQDFSAATPKFLKEAFGFDGTSGTPTPQQQYDTLMRAMAAQFTPIILGESGRTISDGDRQRVAQILGFAVDQTTGKIGQYEGTAFTSESELKSALSEVRSILGSSYSEMDRIYSRYRPEQYSRMQENNQKQEPKNRLRFDINGNPVE